MNKFAQLIGRLGYKFLLSHKEHFIKALNKKIDIPFASEKDEEELLELVWEIIENTFKDLIKK